MPIYPSLFTGYFLAMIPVSMILFSDSVVMTGSFWDIEWPAQSGCVPEK